MCEKEIWNNRFVWIKPLFRYLGKKKKKIPCLGNITREKAKKEEVDTWLSAYFILKNLITKGDKWKYQLDNGIKLEGHKWTPSKTLKDTSN